MIDLIPPTKFNMNLELQAQKSSSHRKSYVATYSTITLSYYSLLLSTQPFWQLKKPQGKSTCISIMRSSMRTDTLLRNYFCLRLDSKGGEQGIIINILFCSVPLSASFHLYAHVKDIREEVLNLMKGDQWTSSSMRFSNHYYALMWGPTCLSVDFLPLKVQLIIWFSFAICLLIPFTIIIFPSIMASPSNMIFSRLLFSYYLSYVIRHLLSINGASSGPSRSATSKAF